MEITGKIIHASEPRGGVSQRTGNTWKSQDFVIEWYENNFPRHCIFTVFGEDRLNQFNIQLNQEYTVSFDIDAHESNGRWFNDIRAWRVAPPQAAAPAAVAAPAPQAVGTPAQPVAPEVPAPTAPAPSFEQAPEDNLPF